MSIGLGAISEQAISGQELMVPTLIPGSVQPYATQGNIRPVTQKWFEDAIPQVFNARQIAP